MAGNLLDAMAAQKEAKKQTSDDSLENLQRMFTAKLGKSIDPKAPRLSRQAQRMAQAVSDADIENVTDNYMREQQKQKEQVRIATQERRQQARQMDETSLAMREKMAQQQAQLLQQFEQAKQKLSMQRKEANAEQLGFIYRLSNEKYVEEFKDVVRRNQLTNDIKFREEMMKAVYADELELVNEDLNFRRLLKADERTFQQELAEMDINAALRIAETHAAASRTAGVISGVGQIAKGGLQFAFMDNKKADTELPEVETRDPRYDPARNNYGSMY